MQLLSSAGIAYDKVVPKGEVLGSLTFNLFKGLDNHKVSAVLGGTQVMPSTNDKVITVNAQDIHSVEAGNPQVANS